MKLSFGHAASALSFVFLLGACTYTAPTIKDGEAGSSGEGGAGGSPVTTSSSSSSGEGGTAGAGTGGSGGAPSGSSSSSSSSSSSGMPPVPCDVFVQTGCDVGEACRWDYPGGQSVCEKAGSGNQGASCNSSSDCAAGYGCFNTGGASFQCLKYCEVGVPCTGGTTCTDTGQTGPDACL